VNSAPDPHALLEARRRLAFALDYPDVPSATRGAELLGPAVGILKVGLELFVRGGPPVVEMAKQSGALVFLDLKLHDIAETVERAVASASQLGVSYLTVHAAGGPAMLERAARRADQDGAGLKILAVTVLTSLDAADLNAIGVSSSPNEQVLRLAALARASGIHGLVCSAEEVAAVRALVGPECVLCTPGIRPAGAAKGDQKRVATPGSAIQSGSSFLVVGRPIRDAADPVRAAEDIVAEIASSLDGEVS
jgi:orotidine-5'-phosphate decarboxylase